jgi:hypothetical protein
MKVDIADGAAAASANLQNLKVGLGDTGKALDIMAAGGNVGAFEVRDMARYFPASPRRPRRWASPALAPWPI